MQAEITFFHPWGDSSQVDADKWPWVTPMGSIFDGSISVRRHGQIGWQTTKE
jgi:hypothetical protein